VRAARLEDVRAPDRASVRVAGHSLALFFHEGRVRAVDNRCPHMGFPLHRGTLRDGILTCHWHHARSDLESGGTFDQFADEGHLHGEKRRLLRRLSGLIRPAKRAGVRVRSI
jgi:nitrite reductase/ring-hydroxylating ferredoxin subunit